MMFVVVLFFLILSSGNGVEGLVHLKIQQRPRQYSTTLKIQVLKNLLSYFTKYISKKYILAIFSAEIILSSTFWATTLNVVEPWD